MPSLPTARALAKWLGWSLEEVFAAAEAPVEGGGVVQLARDPREELLAAAPAAGGYRVPGKDEE